MQRLILALMAMVSLVVTHPGALQAQEDGSPTDPSKSTHIVRHTPDVPHSSGVVLPMPSGAAHIARVHTVTRGVKHHRDWFGAQMALMLFGLLGAALSVIVTPNASRRVADHVSSNPRRDLKLGSLLGLGILCILVVDAALLHTHTFISYLWAPVGIMIFFAPLLVLGFGWLAAMRYTGDFVAHRMNRSGDGSLFGRMALGLFAFFLMNVILGSLCRPLGAIGLCVELSVALMGLGATAAIAAGAGFGRRA